VLVTSPSNRPSSATLRYQLMVAALGLVLVFAALLAVYSAVRSPAVQSSSEPQAPAQHSVVVADYPCFRPLTPC